MSTEITAVLQQFFGANFNQDWDVDGAASWEDVVDRYVQKTPPDIVTATLDAIRKWARSAPEEAALPDEFWCDYSPQADGLTDVEWVRRIGQRMSDRLEEAGQRNA